MRRSAWLAVIFAPLALMASLGFAAPASTGQLEAFETIDAHEVLTVQRGERGERRKMSERRTLAHGRTAIVPPAPADLALVARYAASPRAEQGRDRRFRHRSLLH